MQQKAAQSQALAAQQYHDGDALSLPLPLQHAMADVSRLVIDAWDGHTDTDQDQYTDQVYQQQHGKEDDRMETNDDQQQDVPEGAEFLLSASKRRLQELVAAYVALRGGA